MRYDRHAVTDVCASPGAHHMNRLRGALGMGSRRVRELVSLGAERICGAFTVGSTTSGIVTASLGASRLRMASCGEAAGASCALDCNVARLARPL